MRVTVSGNLGADVASVGANGATIAAKALLLFATETPTLPMRLTQVLRWATVFGTLNNPTL